MPSNADKTTHVFIQIDDDSLSGSLLLDGGKTRLTVFSKEPVASLPAQIHAVDENARHISLLECINFGGGSSGSNKQRIYYCVVFPHYVASGDFHCSIDEEVVDKISFSLTDAKALFWDHSPWRFFDSKSLADLLDINDDEIAEIYGFVGSGTIFKSTTTFGTIAAYHRPTFTSPSVEGFSATNNIKVEIELSKPATIRDSITLMYRVKQFTEICSGRLQGISDVSIIKVGASDDDRWTQIALTISHAEEPERSDDHLTGFDMLASPCIDRTAFEQLVTNWFSLEDRKRWIAFSRFSSNLKQENFYDHNRLVSAASLFEWYDTTLKVDVPSGIRELVDSATEKLQAMPKSYEQQRLRGILGTVGSESLQSKIMRQTNDVLDALKGVDSFDRKTCETVIAWAVKSRNKIVHGTGARKIERILEQHLIFMTETLEVLFGIMSVHSAGWSVGKRTDGRATSFSRYSAFLRYFSHNASQLLADVAQPD